jgi:hypothetical protein
MLTSACEEFGPRLRHYDTVRATAWNHRFEEKARQIERKTWISINYRKEGKLLDHEGGQTTLRDS